MDVNQFKDDVFLMVLIRFNSQEMMLFKNKWQRFRPNIERQLNVKSNFGTVAVPANMHSRYHLCGYIFKKYKRIENSIHRVLHIDNVLIK